MYTLWRGHDLLGEIRPELPGDNDGAVFGMLNPSAAFLPGYAVSQHTMLGWPGQPVFEHMVDRVAPSEEARQGVGKDGPRPLQEAIRESIPTERRLQLRDGAGVALPTRTITIMAMPRANRRMEEQCQAVDVTFSGWCVIASIATP